MKKWLLVYTTQSQKDAKKLSSAGLRIKAEELIKILETNPFQNPPRYEKLVGDLSGAYSRRKIFVIDLSIKYLRRKKS